jgi:outer membrane beta-barrel protein
MENRIKHILLKGALIAGLAMISSLVTAQEDDLPLIEPDVQPRAVDEALIDTENFEIGVFTGIMNIEDFESSFLWGGKLTYHLSERFFFEANVGFAEGGQTSFEKLAGNVSVLSDDERDYRYYNVNLGINILPGEAFLTENYAFNTNFFLIGGAGATEFAGDTRFTANAGAGYQVLLTDSIAVQIAVREHVYRIDVLGEEKTSMNTEVSAGLSVFF